MSSVLLWIEETPGSSLGLPALCPQWQCALLLSLYMCVGVGLGGPEAWQRHQHWLGAEPQLCFLSSRLYM